MLDIQEQANRLVAKLSGELTIQNAEPLKQGLMALLDKGKSISIDLCEVSELDSSGVQLLYYAKQAALSRQFELVLVNHSPAVVEVFELYRLAPVFGDMMILDAEQTNGPRPGEPS